MESYKYRTVLPSLENLEAWQTFINAFPLGLFLLDPDFRIILANQTAANMLAQGPEALRGKLCYEVVHNTKEPPAYCPYQRFLSTHKTEKETFFEKNLNRHLQVTIAPFYDAQGALVSVLHIMMDLTDATNANFRIDELAHKCQLIANQSEAFLFISSQDYEVAFANQSFRDYVGSDIKGKKCYELFCNFTQPCPWCRKEKLKEGEILRREIQNPKDTKWYYLSERVFREGDALSALILALDITSFKEKENELRRRELFLRLLNELLCDFVREEDWSILNKNFESFRDLLGAEHLYLFKRLPGEKGYFLQAVAPETFFSQGRFLSDDIFKIGPCVEPELLAGPLKEFLKEPASFFESLELFSLWHFWPGETGGFLGADFREKPSEFVQEALRTLAEGLGNILARHYAEELLRRERNRLFTVLSSMVDGVIVTDRHGHVVLLNRAATEITGWPEDQALGAPLEEVLRLSFYPHGQPDDVTGTVFSFGKVYRPSRDFILDGKDGQQRRVHLVAAPVRDSKEEVEGAVVVLRDVTRYHSMEEGLRQKEKLRALEVMAAGIAHDFNNLLTAIEGHLSLARLTNDPEKHEHALTLAEQAIAKAQQLVQRLTHFAKRDAPSRAPADVRNVIRETVEFLLSGSKIHFSVDLPEDLWKARVDEVQLAQVIQNLVLNAREAMPEGGTLVVRARNVRVSEEDRLPLPSGSYVCLEVQDTGCGIPEHLLPHIFDPYFTTKKQGTGLGLSVVYGIVTDHEGHVEVHSQEGKGTTFIIYFPAEESSSTEKDGEAIQLSTTAWKKGLSTPKRLLILDDDEEICQLLREMLSFLGYEVEAVSSATEAISRYRQAQEEGKPFHAVLMDFTLSGTDGVQTIAILRRFDPDLRAILMSGYADPLFLKNPDTLGAKAFLKKPFRLEELLQVLSKVCAT